MSDPKRLVDSGALGGRLLASARADAPSRRARERAAAVVGVSVGAASMTTGAVASGATITNASGAGAAAKVAVSAAWMKFIAASALTVAVASGGIVVLEHSAASGPMPSSVPAAPAAPARTVAAAIAAPRDPAPTATVEPAAPAIASEVTPVEIALKTPPKREAPKSVRAPEIAPAPASAPAAAPASTSATSVSGSTLSQELRSLDGARTALDRGDPAGAIAALDRHEREFGAGSLRAEASVLRVEALFARGDRAAAQKLARELLAREPASAHARRLRSIVGEEELRPSGTTSTGVANP